MTFVCGHKLDTMSKTTDDGLRWLDDQLRQSGIDRAELARRGDFSDSALAHVYAGRRNVGRKLAQGIARGLGVSEDRVYKEFGLLGDSDESDNRDEAKLFTELLDDIEDEEKKEEAVGIVTAILRQIAHTSKKGKQRPASKGAGGRSKPA